MSITSQTWLNSGTQALKGIFNISGTSLFDNGRSLGDAVFFLSLTLNSKMNFAMQAQVNSHPRAISETVM
jgi:hypothetical protein